VRGLVIQVRAEGHRIEGERFIAEAGVQMARAATETANAGLSGLEFGLAIPGSVGGAVWANAGAHGQDVAAVIESADVLLPDGREVRLAAADLGLVYRDSRFKARPRDPSATPTGQGPAELVVAAAFRLTPRPADEIKERLDEIRKWRREHQPLGMASAGSVFRNPPGGASAGERIDRAGLKGLRAGGAVVSDKHANFIVNDRGGLAADVRRLAEQVRDEVERRDGIRLELEVVFAGDWSGWPWPAEAEA
jgi:UDP-N-acetylmuramate dehydrogenase